MSTELDSPCGSGSSAVLGAVVAALRDLVAATDDMRTWATNINCSGPWPQPILIKRECDKLRAVYQKHADTLACISAPNVRANLTKGAADEA